MRALKISLLVFILSTTISAQWFVKPVSFDNLLNTVILISPDTGFLAAGYPPGVLKTVDGGNNWIMDSLGSSNLEDMFFINSQIGWVVGADIFKTTDGGENWINQLSGTSSELIRIYFIDQNTGWAAGADGTILHTTDGGTNWGKQSSGTNKTLWSIQFIDQNSGWAVGETGTILHTTDGGGITGIGKEIIHLPQEHSLSQNFPNPFNPVTSMQYAISSRQFVTLKVYDLLGREIAILVNEEKPAGEYEVEFDGVNLPSGIYFYQLKAGSFVETRKMVLMK